MLLVGRSDGEELVGEVCSLKHVLLGDEARAG